MSGRFNPNSYAQVKDRLPLFWAEYPEGRIITEIYALSEDWNRVIVKAAVYCDRDHAEPTTTGFAEETQTPNSGGANKYSHIENCETSAIGRALANFRFQGSIERPSREEMEKAQRMENAPPPTPASNGTPLPHPLLAEIRNQDAPTKAREQALTDYYMGAHTIEELNKRQEAVKGCGISSRVATATYNWHADRIDGTAAAPAAPPPSHAG